MKTIYIILITLSIFSFTHAQTSNSFEDWRNIVLVSKVEGVNTSGFHFEYLQNRNTL